MVSMPVPATAIPANDVEPVNYKHERDVVVGQVGPNQITVSPAVRFDDGEEEPTEEEYATLRK